MNKFLLGLVAVAAILLPISQTIQARQTYNSRYCDYHYVCGQRLRWHQGYWYGGWRRPGYCG